MIENYEVNIRPLASEDGEGFFAWVPQFGEGIHGIAATQAEALQHLSDTITDIAAWEAEEGRQLPAPRSPEPWEAVSGRFSVRLTKLLHYEIQQAALQEGVSLNAFVSEMLSEGMAARRGRGLSAALAAGATSAYLPIENVKVRYSASSIWTRGNSPSKVAAGHEIRPTLIAGARRGKTKV